MVPCFIWTVGLAKQEPRVTILEERYLSGKRCFEVSVPKEELHRLVEALPEHKSARAKRLLEVLLTEDGNTINVHNNWLICLHSAIVSKHHHGHRANKLPSLPPMVKDNILRVEE